jgi:hypothetical protein
MDLKSEVRPLAPPSFSQLRIFWVDVSYTGQKALQNHVLTTMPSARRRAMSVPKWVGLNTGEEKSSKKIGVEVESPFVVGISVVSDLSTELYVI